MSKCAALIDTDWKIWMANPKDDLILLIDDDPTGRAVRKLVLEAHGHSVLAVGEAQAALLTLANNPIRLIIVDYFLEGTTGTALARQMRATKPDVPILLLSGSGDVPGELDYVDEYLSKLEPVAVVEQKIAQLLRDNSGHCVQSRLDNAAAGRGSDKREPLPRMEQEPDAYKPNARRQA
jgi:CheY-like chemotaxis protein